MRIEHVALWAEDIDVLKDFYVQYFKAKASDKYSNRSTGFTSYFLSFEDGARLEVMNKSEIEGRQIHLGYCHIAFSLGCKSDVIHLTEQLRADGFIIEREPRTTGDGYFESLILDPEGNKIEITV